jgi:hypothetical protein
MNWNSWMGEFQVDLTRIADLPRLLRNPAEPLRVSAEIELAPSESEYLRAHAAEILEPLAWREIFAQDVTQASYRALAIGPATERHREEVRRAAQSWVPDFVASLESSVHELEYVINADLSIERRPSRPIEAVFRTFDPAHLGMIDYHGSGRAYTRQGLGGLSLDVESFAQQQRSQSLYNWQGKYANIKTELTSRYMRDLISREADGPHGQSADLNSTLKELFATFFRLYCCFRG